MKIVQKKSRCFCNGSFLPKIFKAYGTFPLNVKIALIK